MTEMSATEQHPDHDRKHHGETLDEPVLDGATEHDPEDENVDPRKGLSDPALIRDVEDDKKTTNPYG